MKKNLYLSTTFLFIHTGLSAENSAAEEPKSTSKRPNILFCIADDWGWPHTQSYGDRVVKTPTFERIAKNGILFEHAYVSAPSCTPSRNAILTGKYHWQLEAGANLWSTYPSKHASYPRLLENAGYYVGAYRKAFGPGRDNKPAAAGDRYKSPQEFFKNRPEDKPFCFWFGSSDPHRGYVKGSGVKSGMNLKNVQVPPVFPDVEAVRSDICDYYFEVQRFDTEVGKVLDMLKKNGELNNTLIIMTGDHGWPFPRGKSNLYDLGTRVPLAIMWGDQLKHKARRYKDFVSLTDIAPTIMEAVNLKPASDMSGRSLKPILLDDSTSSELRTHVITGKERHTLCQEKGELAAPCRAIRNHQFLYIHNFHPDRWPAGAPIAEIRGNYGDIDNGPTKSWIIDNKDKAGYQKFFTLSCAKRPRHELYDCIKDPFQMNNLALDPKFKSKVETLQTQLFNQLKLTGDLQMLGRGAEYEKGRYLGYRSKKTNKNKKK